MRHRLVNQPVPSTNPYFFVPFIKKQTNKVNKYSQNLLLYFGRLRLLWVDGREGNLLPPGNLHPPTEKAKSVLRHFGCVRRDQQAERHQVPACDVKSPLPSHHVFLRFGWGKTVETAVRLGSHAGTRLSYEAKPSRASDSSSSQLKA